MLHRQRRDLDRHEEIEREYAPRNGNRSPRGGERNQQVLHAELDVAVEYQRRDVHPDEQHREPTKEPVQIEQPPRRALLGDHAAGVYESPDDRRAEQRPRHDAARAGEVPPEVLVELRRHASAPSSTASEK
jgi:hypothetical protein